MWPDATRFADYALSRPICADVQPQLQQAPLLFSWIGGHGTVPYEQKTQQSPGSG
ncbi:hypothetical protein V1277_002389 [Bradyrhizobium sp. AZCC 1588]